MERSGVYGIFNKLDGKCYIGATTSFYGRWAHHRSSLLHGSHDNHHLQQAWNQDGEASFEFRVLHLCDEENLVKQEAHFMQALNSCDRRHGYNIEGIVGETKLIAEATRVKLSAANKGKKRSAETRKWISVARFGRTASPEARQAMSMAQTGRKHTEETLAKFRRRRHTKETKAKIAAAHMGKTVSAKTREKLRLANLGKTHSAETKAKIGALSRGRKFTPEHRARLGASIKAAKALKKLQRENGGRRNG